MFLEILQNSQENTCARVSFLIKLQAAAYNFIKKKTLVHVFSCEFCKIPKNIFSYRTRPVAASELTKMFETQSASCLLKLFQKYLSKPLVTIEKSGSFHLKTITSPLTKIWYEKMPWESVVLILWWKIWYQTQLFRTAKDKWQTNPQEKHLYKNWNKRKFQYLR